MNGRLKAKFVFAVNLPLASSTPRPHPTLPTLRFDHHVYDLTAPWGFHAQSCQENREYDDTFSG